MSKALIRTVKQKNLSKFLLEAKVPLTAREVRIIDYCHTLSETTWVCYIDNRLLCAWGIVPPSLMSGEVYLWLHTTEAVSTNQFFFIRKSQLFVQELLRDYTAIVGHVNVHAQHSKRWLKWLGARFGNEVQNNMVAFRIER